MRLQSAIFDMDGTLLDSMGMWNDLGADMLRALGKEPRPDLRRQLETRSLRQGAAYCKEAYGLSQSVEDVMELISSRIRTFYHSEVRAKPGVQEFLSLLKMEGVWMYVATATGQTLAEDALRHAGIRDYFRGVISCEDVGRGKDDPEVFERALRRLRSTKQDTVVFEDALFAIRTAKAAGFRVAAVYDPSAEKDQDAIREIADYYIRSYEEMFETDLLE